METVIWIDPSGEKRKSGLERAEAKRFLAEEGGAAWVCCCELCSDGFCVEELEKRNDTEMEPEGGWMEIREYRCCMCPQRNAASEICPAGPGKPYASICDFVITWTDERGWKYKVMPGIGNDQYKGRYQDEKHDGGTGWKGMRQLSWRSTFDKAQEDLNRLAIKKQWKPVCLYSGGRNE